MDNFKFMDSWPAWLRWLAVLAILGAAALWHPRSPTDAIWIEPWVWGQWLLWQLWTAVFIWVCIAAAPKFKWVIALLVGIVSLVVASYRFNPVMPGSIFFLQFSFTWPFAIGLIVAWGLAIGGFLQRRGVAFSGVWFALALALFVGLNVASFLDWNSRLMDFSNTYEAFTTLTYWFIGRELALAAVAIGGALVLYLLRRKRAPALPGVPSA